jgi:hypothetical protein
MALNGARAVPTLGNDDGVVFIFQIQDSNGKNWQCGFFHRPIQGSKPVGGTVHPPVTWTQYDNLNSWVETLKYGARNGTQVVVSFDDEISIHHTSWSAPPGYVGSLFIFQQVYDVVGFV